MSRDKRGLRKLYGSVQHEVGAHHLGQYPGTTRTDFICVGTKLALFDPFPCGHSVSRPDGKLLEHVGIDPRRFQVRWISASEGNKFAEVIKELTENVKAIGPQSNLKRVDKNG